MSTEHQSNSAVPAFLEAFPGVLSSAECEAIIGRFEMDPRKFSSRTQTRAVPLIRSGMMLPTYDFPEWRDVTDRVEAIIRERLQDYTSKYQSLRNLAALDRYFISGALIERIEPGQGYGFHIDAGTWGTQERFLATLIYLRDVHDGGLTEFPYQSLRVAPRAGLLLMFPPFWTHPHRGVPPISGTKYNITNFVCTMPPSVRSQVEAE